MYLTLLTKISPVENVSAIDLYKLAATIARMSRDPSDFTYGVMFGIAGRANFEPAYLALGLLAAGGKERNGAEQLARIPWLKTKLEQSIARGNPTALAIQARFAFKNGHVQEAAASMEKVLETAGEYVEVQGYSDAKVRFEADRIASWLAECYFALGENDKAIAAVANRTALPEVAARMAEIQLEAGNLEKAREAFYNNGNPRGPPAFEKLSLIESTLAEGAQSKAERDEHWRWAKEWNLMGRTVESLAKQHGRGQSS